MNSLTRNFGSEGRVLQLLSADQGLGSDYGTSEIHDLYHRSIDPAFAVALFGVAARLRDRHIGRAPWWSADIAAITLCDQNPPGTDCASLIGKAANKADIVAAAAAISALGIRHLHLSGGTRRGDDPRPGDGCSDMMIDLVEAIRERLPDLRIEIDAGPSLTRDDVRALKQLGVAAITSSLEVLQPALFARYKPGDSLAARIRLMEMCEEEQVPIRAMMLVGLGESDEDRIEHLLFLRRFAMLRHLRLSRYMPSQNTAAGDVRCSPWPLARLITMARLIYPAVDLGLAAGNDPDDIALWWLAGGGNQVLGASASMKATHGKSGGETRTVAVGEHVAVHNNMPRITRYLGELGLVPAFAPPATLVQLTTLAHRARRS